METGVSAGENGKRKQRWGTSWKSWITLLDGGIRVRIAGIIPIAGAPTASTAQPPDL